MPSYPLLSLGSRFSAALPALHDDALPESRWQHIADDRKGHFAVDDVSTPALTLWAFVVQVLSASKSCVAAVARVLALRSSLGRPPCSANTGADCKARSKLPEAFLQRLTDDVGVTVEEAAPDPWRWHRRRVLLADGFAAT